MRSALADSDSDQLPFSLQSSDVVNGQLIAVVRREAYAPTAWGPTPGQAGGFAPVPTVPPAVSVSSFGVMGSQSGGYTAGLGGASEATNNGPGMGGGNSAAAVAAGLFPWNWKLSPLPWAIVLLLVSILVIRVVNWK